MKVREIQDLINFIASSGLDEVNLETDDIKLHIKRNAEGLMVPAASLPVAAPAPQPLAAAPAPAATPAVEAPQAAAPQGGDESNYVTIKSPMIGTFYTAANPESPDFVSIGESVKPGKVVCIIEAMKLFNEIESEVSGKIVKVLVDNASPVEFDQPLFLVDPS